MSVAPESRRQFVLASGPPAFAASDDDDGIGLENLADGFREIPAKIDSDTGFHGCSPAMARSCCSGELHRHLGRLEFQRIRNHLRDVDGNAGAEAAGQSAG